MDGSGLPWRSLDETARTLEVSETPRAASPALQPVAQAIVRSVLRGSHCPVTISGSLQQLQAGDRTPHQRRIAAINAQAVCQGFNFPPPQRLSSGEVIIQVILGRLARPTIHMGKNPQVVRQG